MVRLFRVALRTEGVDRKYRTHSAPSLPRVALRTEGVDRKKRRGKNTTQAARRPPYGGRG